MECVICGQDAGFFSHSCRQGKVCGDCYSKTPSFFPIQNQDVGVIKHICREYDNQNEQMCKVFAETCKVGNLHFDGDNLLMVIGKVQKDGTVEDGCSDIFSVANVSDVSFSMTNARKVNGKIYCNVVFTCTFHNTFWKINSTILKGAVCLIEKDSYTLPVGVRIVWDEIVKKINANRTQLENTINNELPTKEDFLLFKAKVLFMLDKNYTEEDVMDSYSKLLNAFQSDTAKISVIEDAKELLLLHFLEE